MKHKYYSQGKQDQWISEIFNFKTNGFYLDIGAMDGVVFSNTFALENNLSWKGVCVEPDKTSFEFLNKNRKSINRNIAISNYDGECFLSGSGACVAISETGIETAPCLSFDSFLKEIANEIPKEIDYLSIDIEGQEFNALSTLNFNEWFIKAITLEHNLYCEGSKNKELLYNLLTSKGFVRVVDNAVCLDLSPHVFNQPYEDWYINSKCVELLNHPFSNKQPL